MRVVRVVRVVSLLTQAAAASGLMVGDQIRSVNGAALGGGADAMRRFCAEANSTSKTLAVEFTRPPRPRGAALVGRIFRLPAQKVRFIVTAFTETTRQHRVLFYGPRAPLCLSDDDWSSVAALCAHFGERPVPMDARAAHVSITVVGRGGVMHRAGDAAWAVLSEPHHGKHRRRAAAKLWRRRRRRPLLRHVQARQQDTRAAAKPAHVGLDVRLWGQS